MKEVLLVHLLGYLTPEQWIDAYNRAIGVGSNFNKEKVRMYALDINEQYHGDIFTDEQLRKLGVKNPKNTH